MFTLYNLVSADGFIARPDGREDFIPDSVWQKFLDLCQAYGTLVMGRKTYDAIQSYDQKLIDEFESLAVTKIVISHNKEFKAKTDYHIVSTPEAAATIVPDALVCSGPTLNNYVLRKHLVKEILLYQLLTPIGEGIEPFDNQLVEGLKDVKITRLK